MTPFSTTSTQPWSAGSHGQPHVTRGHQLDTNWTPIGHTCSAAFSNAEANASTNASTKAALLLWRHEASIRSGWSHLGKSHEDVFSFLLVQVLQSSQLTPAMSNVSCMGYEQLQLRRIETYWNAFDFFAEKFPWNLSSGTSWHHPIDPHCCTSFMAHTFST